MNEIGKRAKRTFGPVSPLIVLSILIYLSGFLIGVLLFSFFSPNLSNLYSQDLYPMFGFEDMPKKPTFQEKPNTLMILRNNGLMIMILISGSALLGLTTFTNLSLNGFIFGVAIGSLVQEGIKFSTIVFITMLHGIFELPATWFGGAAGLKGPQVFIRYLKGGKFVTHKDVREFLALSVVSTVLIIIAGLVEANVTLKIGEVPV